MQEDWNIKELRGNWHYNSIASWLKKTITHPGQACWTRCPALRLEVCVVSEALVGLAHRKWLARCLPSVFLDCWGRIVKSQSALSTAWHFHWDILLIFPPDLHVGTSAPRLCIWNTGWKKTWCYVGVAPKNTPGFNLNTLKTSNLKRPLTDLNLTFDLTSQIFAAMFVTFDLIRVLNTKLV